ncbi:MAG: preprotein translocase subunit SecA, partial [Chloroflexus sp.]|nr:preprotein translocase subunit SecA [Chloroflexus sp.]
LLKLIAGDPNKKDIERYSRVVAQINDLEPQFRTLSDAELRAKTDVFKQRIAAATAGIQDEKQRRAAEQAVLNELLPEAFDALLGRGVHVVTVNDYLARRDARWMGPIYRMLGLSVGVLQEAHRTENATLAFLYDPDKTASQEDQHQLRLVPRKEAYAADVTYGTNNEFGFDYLRDNMALSLEQRVQRERYYAIVDEVDNILIDEARTPLIISGPSQEAPELYYQCAKVVKQLRPEHFEIDERNRTIALNEM